VWASHASRTMNDDPITSMDVIAKLDWTAAKVDMAMGATRYIGVLPYLRYTPQSSRADAFMTQWCSEPANANDARCSCIKDEPAYIALSDSLRATLPVTCFAEKCARHDSYKLRHMADTTCNTTMCNQSVQNDQGVVAENQLYMQCNGGFYVSQRIFPSPTGVPIDADEIIPERKDISFYVWIMLGVSGAIFILLVYLMFRPQAEIRAAPSGASPSGASLVPGRQGST